METEPWLQVSSNRLVKPGSEPATPGLQGKQFIHYTTAALFNQMELSAIYLLNFFLVDAIYRPLVKSANQKNKVLISQPKHVLWVLKRTVSLDSAFEHQNIC